MHTDQAADPGERESEAQLHRWEGERYEHQQREASLAAGQPGAQQADRRELNPGERQLHHADVLPTGFVTVEVSAAHYHAAVDADPDAAGAGGRRARRRMGRAPRRSARAPGRPATRGRPRAATPSPTVAAPSESSLIAPPRV